AGCEPNAEPEEPSPRSPRHTWPTLPHVHSPSLRANALLKQNETGRESVQYAGSLEDQRLDPEANAPGASPASTHPGSSRAIVRYRRALARAPRDEEGFHMKTSKAILLATVSGVLLVGCGDDAKPQPNTADDANKVTTKAGKGDTATPTAGSIQI